jgi:hypothetical protein
VAAQQLLGQDRIDGRHGGRQQDEQGPGREAQTLAAAEGDERHTGEGQEDAQPANAGEAFLEHRHGQQRGEHRGRGDEQGGRPGLNRHLAEVQGHVVDADAEEAREADQRQFRALR